jgi:tetratricopeptide (TPR) repeat protein
MTRSPALLLLSLPGLVAPAAEELGILLRQAREARDAGRWNEALVAYDAMLAQVATHETALFERAQCLTWAGRYAEGREAWQRFRQAVPARTLDADLWAARLEAWDGRLGRAQALLAPHVAAARRQAVLDSATYLAWDNQHGAALERLKAWRQGHPEDLEAALLEAKVLTWDGRRAEARRALQALQPQGGAQGREARTLLRGLQEEQGPILELRRSHLGDNEDLAIDDTLARLTLPLGDGSVHAQGGWHTAVLPGARATWRTVGGGLAYPVGPLRFVASVDRLSELGGAPATAHRLSLDVQVRPGLRLNLAQEVAWATFTPAALTHRTAFRIWEGGATWRLRGHSLEAGLGRADLSAGSTRNHWSGAYAHQWRRGAWLGGAGLLARGFGYDRTLALGFFNPGRYRFTGLTSTLGYETPTFSCSLGARGGRQSVDQAPSQFAWGYDLGATWRPSDLPLALTTGFSGTTAGLPVAATASPTRYRDQGWRLGLRIYL